MDNTRLLAMHVTESILTNILLEHPEGYKVFYLMCFGWSFM